MTFKVLGLKVGGKQGFVILVLLVVASLCFNRWGFGFSDCGGLCFLGKCS